MTSDRGNTGAAEMQLPSTPVTPKTTNLNPNATVFHSSKGPATPPDSATEGGWSPEFEAPTTTTITPVESITYVNGEADLPLPTNITFPPTPESPPQPPPPPPMVVEYTNSSISSDVSGSGGVGGSGVVTEMVITGDNKLPGVAAPVEPGSTLEAQVLFPASEDGSISPNVSADENILEGALPDNQLRAMLKHQLEYYFSRENLAQDSYLVSQMDADQFVPISTIAKFNQVKKLTANLDLVVDVLRESTNVQVDDKGEKVRPVHQRCVVILREVPETTPVQDVEQLFMGANCPKFVSCEFASGNCWYITFDSEEDAQRAYQYLREEVQLFLGKPIMARIKAKPILRTYGPKTNVYKVPGATASAATSPTAPVTPPTITPIATPQQQQIISPQQPPEVFSPPQQPAKMAAYPPPPPQPVASVVSSMQNVNVPFISSQQQQQSVPVSLPFFPPSNNSVPIWSQQPAAVTFFTDPSTAFAANGYTPTGTFKLPNASNKHQPQPHTHAYQNVRNSQQQYRNQKSSRYGQQTATPPQQLPSQLAQQLPQPQQVHSIVAAAAQAAAAVNSNNTTPTAQQQQLTAPAATATLHQQQQTQQQQQPALTHHTQSLQQPTMTAVQVNSATTTTPVTPLATAAQMGAVAAPPAATHTHVSAMLAAGANENAAAAAANNLLEGGATTIVSAVSSNTGAGGHSSAPPSSMMMSSGNSTTNNTNSSTQRSTVSVQHAQQGAIGGGNMNGERHNLSIPPPPPAPVAVNGGGGGSTGTGHSSRASPRGMNSNNMGIGGYESVPHATFSGQHSVYGGSGVVGGVATPGGMRPHRGEASYHHSQHHQHGGGAGGGGPSGNHTGPPPPHQQHQHGPHHHHHPAAPTSGHHHHGNSQQYHHSHSYHNNHQSNTSNHSHHPSQSHSNNYHSSESGAPTAGPGPSHPHSRYQPHGGGGGGTASGSHGNSAMNHNHAEASVKEIPPRHQRNRDRDLDRRQEERRPDRREEGRVDDRRDYYRNRRRGRMEEGEGAKRNAVTAKDRIPESFELEANSFPPLPGSQNNTSSNGVFESKMSDVVKGCAKSIGTSTKDTTNGAGTGVSSARPYQSKTTDHLKETVSVSATATPAEAAGKQRRSSTPPATGSGISGGGHGISSSTSTGGSQSTGQMSSITMAAVAAAGPTVSCPPPPTVTAADHLAVCVTTATPAPSTATSNKSATQSTPPLSPQKVNKAITAKPANCPQKSAAETITTSAPPVKSGPEPSTTQSKVETQQPKARSHSTTKVEESTPDRSTGPAPAPGLVPSKMSYASVVSKPNQPPLTNGEAAVSSSEKAGEQQQINSSPGSSKLDQQQQSNAADQSTVSVPQEAGKKSPTREVNNYRRGDRDNDRRGGSDRDDRDTTTGGYNNRGGPAMRGDRYDGPKDQRPSFGGRRGGNYRRDRGDRDSYNNSNRGDKEYYGSNHRGGDKDYYGNRGGDKDYYGSNHRGGDKEYYSGNNHRGGDKEYYGNNHRGGDGNKDYYGGNRSGDKEYYGGGNRGGDKDSYNSRGGGGGGYRGGRMMDRDSFQRDRRKDERIAVKE